MVLALLRVPHTVNLTTYNPLSKVAVVVSVGIGERCNDAARHVEDQNIRGIRGESLFRLPSR